MDFLNIPIKQYVERNGTLLKNIDFIIPVPLHKTKKKTRGFNQSELIADGISTYLNKKPTINTLIKRTPTRAQSELTKSLRKTNLENAFFCI
jgi:predicted amidophosphoribosyltransferase